MICLMTFTFALFIKGFYEAFMIDMNMGAYAPLISNIFCNKDAL